MKLPSYHDALKMGKEKLQELFTPIKVNKARKKAELEMANLDESIATTVDKLTNLCCEEDLDFKKIIEKQDELALLERKKAQYQTIIDQMFPEEKAE